MRLNANKYIKYVQRNISNIQGGNIEKGGGRRKERV